jgi:hypothetical protein
MQNIITRRRPCRPTIVCVVLAIAASPAWAQSSKKIGIGAQASVLQVSGSTGPTDVGAGGRASYRITDRLDLEGEINFFPQDADDVLKGGQKTQALVGVKAGYRNDRFGVFAKARPGFVRFGEGQQPAGTACILIFPPPASCFVPETRFAMDLGGVLEVYLAAAAGLRLDVGDTIIRATDNSLRFGTSARTTNNVQVSGGFLFRF